MPRNAHAVVTDESADAAEDEPPEDAEPYDGVRLPPDPSKPENICWSFAGNFTTSMAVIDEEEDPINEIVTVTTGSAKTNMMLRIEMTPSASRNALASEDFVKGAGTTVPPAGVYVEPAPVGFVLPGNPRSDALETGEPKLGAAGAGLPAAGVAGIAGAGLPAAGVAGADVVEAGDPKLGAPVFSSQNTLVPHFAQKEAPGLSSLPHLPQNIFHSLRDARPVLQVNSTRVLMVWLQKNVEHRRPDQRARCIHAYAPSTTTIRTTRPGTSIAGDVTGSTALARSTADSSWCRSITVMNDFDCF